MCFFSVENKPGREQAGVALMTMMVMMTMMNAGGGEERERGSRGGKP